MGHKLTALEKVNFFSFRLNTVLNGHNFMLKRAKKELAKTSINY